ncbi:lectin domain containing protein [Parasponia andersonii]|uniref:Lectin domain containing protein n=1 Tax=Parasponia andersonii TaxID=3476 RepID=A0A2P5BW21_PARAD|nr:lectin domain containing protein [Parasponia andersonii]
MVASSLVFISISAILLSFVSTIVFAADSLRPSESIKDGGTLVSSDGSFELGFFIPGISKNRYLGIWYKNIPVQTSVWVANRCNPIINMSRMLTLNSSGNLVLLGHNKTVVWSSSSSSSKQAQKPILPLQDTGNLVVGDEKDNGVVMYSWQSFDYPSNTGLPGMKTGFNLKTGFNWVLSAWRNPDNPCPDDYTFCLESHTNPELYIMEGKTKMYRPGPWNGIRFSGVPELTTNQLFDFRLFTTKMKPVDGDDPLHCGEKHKDGFVKFSGLKLPEATNSWVDKSMSLNECGANCVSNCSCMAHTNLIIRGEGSGCVMWFGDVKS